MCEMCVFVYVHARACMRGRMFVCAFMHVVAHVCGGTWCCLSSAAVSRQASSSSSSSDFFKSMPMKTIWSVCLARTHACVRGCVSEPLRVTLCASESDTVCVTNAHVLAFENFRTSDP